MNLETIQLGWTFDPARPVFQRRIEEPARPEIKTGYFCRATLWTRCVLCPHCTGLIPLAPNWRLDTKQKLGIQLVPYPELKVTGYRVVPTPEVSRGLYGMGIAHCWLCGGSTRKGYLSEQARLNKPDIPPGPSGLGGLGSVAYCWVVNRWYPVYRHRQPPLQGKDPLEYRVPDALLYHAYAERERLLALNGLTAFAVKEDPLLQGMGIWDEDEPAADFVPGLAAMLGGEDMPAVGSTEQLEEWLESCLAKLDA